jgi:hypothetical protein
MTDIDRHFAKLFATMAILATLSISSICCWQAGREVADGDTMIPCTGAPVGDWVDDEVICFYFYEHADGDTATIAARGKLFDPNGLPNLDGSSRLLGAYMMPWSDYMGLVEWLHERELPPDLFESELYAILKGHFSRTGAGVGETGCPPGMEGLPQPE